MKILSFCKQLLMYDVVWGASSGIYVLIKEHPASLLKSGCLGEKFGRLVVGAEFGIDSALGSSGV